MSEAFFIVLDDILLRWAIVWYDKLNLILFKAKVDRGRDLLNEFLDTKLFWIYFNFIVLYVEELDKVIDAWSDARVQIECIVDEVGDLLLYLIILANLLKIELE